MEKYSEIINFIKKSKSIITAKDFKNNDIGYYYINKLVEDNYIKRISSGIYGKTDSFDDDYYIIQQRYKKIVYSYNTALFLMNETEVTPNQIEITIPREYNIRSFGEEIKLHYINKDYLYLGAIKLKSPYGNDVICYNLERTICDIVKNENSLDKEQLNKIIRNSFQNSKIDGNKIIEYAIKLKCEKKIRAIMEVMI